MNIEIYKPELLQRLQAQIQSGNFHNRVQLPHTGVVKWLDTTLETTPTLPDQGRPLPTLDSQIAADAGEPEP